MLHGRHDYIEMDKAGQTSMENSLDNRKYPVDHESLVNIRNGNIAYYMRHSVSNVYC